MTGSKTTELTTGPVAYFTKWQGAVRDAFSLSLYPGRGQGRGYVPEPTDYPLPNPLPEYRAREGIDFCNSLAHAVGILSRRLPAIFLLVSIALLASGAAEYVHNLAHAYEDAAAGLPAPRPHDETNCLTHAQLHLPMVQAGYVPLLVFLGLFVAFLTQLPRAIESRRVPIRLDCRGPPTC